MRRFVYLGIALGLTLGSAGLAMPACYHVPEPPCGFRCGPAGECPADYTCSSLEPRCHLDGTDPALRCDGTDGPDAAIDSPSDSPIDAAIDTAVDTPTDTPIDTPID
jgi:hypothetical protein